MQTTHTSTMNPSPLQLEKRIYERITSRLGPRIRDLSVRVFANCVRLCGECSTFYSKQLAQEITLAVLEDETIDNQIEVMVRQTA